MKSDGQNGFSGAGKLMISSYPLLKLFSYLFFIVIGFTLGITFSDDSKTFSFKFQLNNGGFSIFSSKPLPPPPHPIFPQPRALKINATTALNLTVTEPSSKTEDLVKSPPVAHSIIINDEELLRRASTVPKGRDFTRNPKVAFMFLTRGRVILAPLWELFFKGHDGLYSIYVHSDPNYVGLEPPDSVFHGSRIPSKNVQWGNVNMVEAERRLLANALLDYSNQYFVLLSESCIPLFNFSTVYSYLLNSTQSFIQSFDDPSPVGRGRYSRHMLPLITLNQWRKGSQWFAMDRGLAIEVISDITYFPLFQKYCHRSCYADEHYLPTLANIKFGESNSNRTLTWVDWSRGGPHPARFYRPHVTPQFLEWLRSGSTCEHNGNNTNMCFLFARKFTEHALWRLMLFAPKVLHLNE